MPPRKIHFLNTPINLSLNKYHNVEKHSLRSEDPLHRTDYEGGAMGVWQACMARLIVDRHSFLAKCFSQTDS